MIRKSNHINSNSRARDKSNKRVRANNLSKHSTNKPNASESEIVFGCRSTSEHSTMTLVLSKTAKARPSGRYAVKKTAAGRQSVEVLKNVPTTESTFLRFSTEIRHKLSCHMAEEMTIDEQEFYVDQHVSPCDLVHECLECRYFHDDFFNILNYRKK